MNVFLLEGQDSLLHTGPKQGAPKEAPALGCARVTQG